MDGVATGDSDGAQLVGGAVIGALESGHENEMGLWEEGEGGEKEEKKEKNFERRGRKGFAKGVKKEKANKTKKQILSTFSMRQLFFGTLIFAFFLSFFLSSSALSAQPSRPLRSKNSLVLKELKFS
jgi:hypothetical protein